MPLADLATTAVLTRLTAATWTQLSAVPTPVTGGFDTLDVVWLCDFRGTAKTALEVAAAFPQGTLYGTSDFWLRSATPERLGGNVWRVMAHYEGRISSGKPRSVRWLSGAEVFSIDSVTVGSFVEVPANVRECSPSVEIGYVQVGGTPNTALVGLAGTPTTVPATRTAAWGSLFHPRINYPSGWVLEGMDSDQIDGAAAYYIRETWQYYFEQLPP
jgi:hypothetical protein